MLLFCNYQTFVVTTENDTKKAQGGKRVIYTSHHPAWDAKTRVPLPEILDLDYESIAPAVEPQKKQRQITDQPASDDGYAVYERFRELMAESGVTEADVRRVVAMKGHFKEDVPVKDYGAQFIQNWLIKYWPQIMDIIDNTKNDISADNENI